MGRLMLSENTIHCSKTDEVVVAHFEDVVAHIEDVVAHFEDVVAHFEDVVAHFDDVMVHFEDMVVHFEDVVVLENVHFGRVGVWYDVNQMIIHSVQ